MFDLYITKDKEGNLHLCAVPENDGPTTDPCRIEVEYVATMSAEQATQLVSYSQCLHTVAGRNNFLRFAFILVAERALSDYAAQKLLRLFTW